MITQVDPEVDPEEDPKVDPEPKNIAECQGNDKIRQRPSGGSKSACRWQFYAQNAAYVSLNTRWSARALPALRHLPWHY